MKNQLIKNPNSSGKFLFSLMFLVALVLSMQPEMASAIDFKGTLCKVFNCFFGSDIVIIIGTIAIIFLGIGAFFGKLNWGLCIVVIIGVIIIGSASEIAAFIAGDGAGCDNGSTTCS